MGFTSDIDPHKGVLYPLFPDKIGIWSVGLFSVILLPKAYIFNIPPSLES